MVPALDGDRIQVYTRRADEEAGLREETDWEPEAGPLVCPLPVEEAQVSMRGYIRTYLAGRLAAQVILNRQPGFYMCLLPTMDVAVQNTWANVAVELGWLFGSVTLGFMSKKWVEAELGRRQEMAERAGKLGLTLEQFRLRRYAD